MRRYVLAFCLAGLASAAVALAAPPANDDRADPVALDLPATVTAPRSRRPLTTPSPSAARASADRSGTRFRPATSAGSRCASVPGETSTRWSRSSPRRAPSSARWPASGPTRTAGAPSASPPPRISATSSGSRDAPNSVPGNFQLEVFSPQAPAVPPGAPLPRAGVTLALDRLENTDDAFSARLREGRLLPSEPRSARRALHRPCPLPAGHDHLRGGGGPRAAPGAAAGTSSSHPDPGRAGATRSWWSRTTTVRVAQRYHLQVAPAGPDDSLPGRRLRRFTRGALRGGQIDAVDLYRFDVVRRSTVNLSLASSDDTDDFDLQLQRQGGRLLECGCGESGDEEIERRLRPGRYYVAVQDRAAARRPLPAHAFGPHDHLDPGPLQRAAQAQHAAGPRGVDRHPGAPGRRAGP